MVAVARRAGVPLTLDRFDELSRAHAARREHPAGGQVPDGGLLLRRRPARAAGRDRRSAVARRAHRQRPDARREHRRRRGVQPRRDPAARQGAGRQRQPRGAARQPRAGRRGDQARGGGVALAASTPGPRSCSPTTTTWRRASTIRRLPVTTDSVLVLQNAGPLGAPGMPEWGQLPIPKKLLAHGVRDMVRISDARMSGTSYGACVLHVAPESFVGGPLALVRDGDLIELDVAGAQARAQGRRRGARAPPRRVEAAGAAVRARLRRALPAAHHAGRPGLRFRFPRRHRADRRTGDPLSCSSDLPVSPEDRLPRRLTSL